MGETHFTTNVLNVINVPLSSTLQLTTREKERTSVTHVSHMTHMVKKKTENVKNALSKYLELVDPSMVNQSAIYVLTL